MLMMLGCLGGWGLGVLQLADAHDAGVFGGLGPRRAPADAHDAGVFGGLGPRRAPADASLTHEGVGGTGQTRPPRGCLLAVRHTPRAPEELNADKDLVLNPDPKALRSSI